MNIDNATVVEFLAANQPDLIKQWHSHVGINALKQLAEEYSEKPEPVQEYPLIDERLVHNFIERLMFSDDDDDSAEEYGKHRTSEFWNETEQRNQARHLFDIWLNIVEFSDPKKQFFPFDPYETMFDYEEIKNEIEKARRGATNG